MTANSRPESVARHFRNGIPALVVGSCALLLVLYGYFVQPSRLANWYGENEKNVSQEFRDEIAANNPGRTVKSVMESARRGRIVHQRLLQIQNNAASETVSASVYMIDVAKALLQWLSEDQGFITDVERESIIQLCSEYLEESRSNLVGLLKSDVDSDSKSGSDAIRTLAKEFMLRAALTADQSELLRTHLIKASDASPKDSQLATYAAEMEIDKLTEDQSLTSSQVLDRLAERVAGELSMRGVIVLATRSLNENPVQTVRLVEKSLSKASIRDNLQDIENQLSVIKASAIVADWKDVETLLPKALNSCILPSYKQYVRTSLAQYFETLMASQLPVVVPVWCERADLCENLVIQIDPGQASAANRLFDVAAIKIKNSSDCMSQSLLSSSLFPLKGVITLLGPGGEKLEPTVANEDWNVAANVAAQICLSKSNSDQTALQVAIKVLTNLTEKFPENGNVWYTDAILQYKAGKVQEALQSARAAQKLLGDLPSILYLIKELEVQK
jgi:hypothetical protein